MNKETNYFGTWISLGAMALSISLFLLAKRDFIDKEKTIQKDLSIMTNNYRSCQDVVNTYHSEAEEVNLQVIKIINKQNQVFQKHPEVYEYFRDENRLILGYVDTLKLKDSI